MKCTKLTGLGLALAAVALLAGCAPAGEDELRAWVVQERAQARPRITPLTEPVQFQPQDYSEESGMEPFNSLKLTQALRRDSARWRPTWHSSPLKWRAARSRWRLFPLTP